MGVRELGSYEGFVASLRCFDWLPPGMGATDLDLVIERKGRILVIESKPLIGSQVLVPLGQWLTLTALAGKRDLDVWLVAHDETAKSKEQSNYVLRVVTPDSKARRVTRGGIKQVAIWLGPEWEGHTLDSLRARMEDWYNRTTANPRP